MDACECVRIVMDSVERGAHRAEEMLSVFEIPIIKARRCPCGSNMSRPGWCLRLDLMRTAIDNFRSGFGSHAVYHLGPSAIESLKSTKYGMLSGSRDGLLRLHSHTDLSVLREFRGHGSEVWALEFTPESETVFSGSADTTLRVWDLHTASCLHVDTSHDDSVFSIKSANNQHTLYTGRYVSKAALVRLCVSYGSIQLGHEAASYGVVAGGPDTHSKAGNGGRGRRHLANRCGPRDREALHRQLGWIRQALGLDYSPMYRLNRAHPSRTQLFHRRHPSYRKPDCPRPHTQQQSAAVGYTARFWE